MRAKRCNLKGKGCVFVDTGEAIESVVLTELGIEDLETAMSMADERGAGASPLFESVKNAIVEVNGRPVEQPYEGFGRFSAQTLEYLVPVYKELNGITEENRADFTKACVEDLELPSRARSKKKRGSDDDS